MAKAKMTIEKLKKMVGREGKPVVIEVEKGMIRRFAEAVNDPNPLWQDEEYARKSRYGGIVGPPPILCAAMMAGQSLFELIPELPGKRMLDRGGEWEFFLPIKPGDIITATTRLSRVVESEGRLGKMILVVTETTHTNQRMEVVARSQGMLVVY